MSVPKLRFKREDGSNYPDWTPAAMGNYYTERREAGNDKLPVLSVSIHSGVSNNELDEAELGKRVKRIEDKSAYRVAHKGDLVFNMMRAWQGAVGSSPTKGMVSPAYIVAIPDERLDPDFMNYYVQTRSVIDEFNMLSYGVTDFRKRLYWDSFSIAKFHVPSIEEQKRIADCLSGIDKMLQICHEELEKTKQFKKAYLQKMFPQKGRTLPEVRFPGFTDEWEQRKLGDRMYIKSRVGWQALTKDEYMSTGDYYLITGTDIDSNHTVDLSRSYYVSKERYEMDTNIQVKNGDIIITKDGTIGKVAMISGLDKPATLNSHLFVLRDQSGELDSNFFLQLLCSHIFEQFVESVKTGSTLTGLPQKTIVEFKFLYPSLAEQEKIGA